MTINRNQRSIPHIRMNCIKCTSFINIYRVCSSPILSKLTCITSQNIIIVVLNIQKRALFSSTVSVCWVMAKMMMPQLHFIFINCFCLQHLRLYCLQIQSIQTIVLTTTTNPLSHPRILKNIIRWIEDDTTIEGFS